MVLNQVKPVVFVTGTDTEIGKTYCSCLLLEAAKKQGLKALGYKPVASGSLWQNNRYENEDALSLQAASSLQLPYESHNQYSFAEATAPHFLVGQDGIDFVRLSQGLEHLKQQADFTLVEGAGGWYTPLGKGIDFADWVKQEQLPVILIVGMKLGSINHALLTVEAIKQSGLPLLGWVANFVNAPHARDEDYLQALQERMNAPCLAVVKYGEENRLAAIEQLQKSLASFLSK